MAFRNALVLPVLLLATGVAAVPTVGHAQSVARLIAQGDSLLAIDRPQKAVDKFTQAIEQEPTAINYSARARAWYHMERMDRYLLDVDKALKLDPKLAPANLQRAVYALRGEDLHNADAFATTCIANASGDTKRQALVIRGQARAELKMHAEAVADLREGLGDRVDDLPALKAFARALDATGDHAGSLAVLEKLCTADPYDIGNWTNRGYELAALGRHADALVIYNAALALDKDEPTVLSNRAHSYLELGRADEAFADVERSLKSYPGNPFALRTRGILLVRKGQMEKACLDLQLARIIGGVLDIDELIEKHCSGSSPKR